MGDLTELSNLLKLLADPTRLSIFNLLMGGVHCNCEISEKIDIPANLISHHLKVLTKAGLITSFRKENDARWIYYCPEPEKVAALRTHLDEFLNENRIADREPNCPPCKKLNNPECKE